MQLTFLLLYPVIVLLSTLLSVCQRVSVSASFVVTCLAFSHHPVPELNTTTPVAQAMDAVPQIIHRIQLGQSTQEADGVDTCERLHPAWQIKRWTSREGDELVKNMYGDEMYRLYQSYETDDMRTDVLSYMIIHTHGGVFLDRKWTCRGDLDPLAWAASVNQTLVTDASSRFGVSNSFLMAPPDHPLLAFVISRLPRYSLDWFGSPTVTRELVTGNVFFSTAHLSFKKSRQQLLRFLPRRQSIQRRPQSTDALFELMLDPSARQESGSSLLLRSQVRPFSSAVAAPCELKLWRLERPWVHLLGDLVTALAALSLLMILGLATWTMRRLVSRRFKPAIQLDDTVPRTRSLDNHRMTTVKLV